MRREPLNLRKLKARPLAERESLTRVEDILVSPDAPPPAIPDAVAERVRECAARA